PGALDLPRLVADFRAAGIDVTLDITGEMKSVPPAAGLSLYRITQESLTNVAKHAPGARASVTLTIDDEGIRLDVRNGPGAIVAQPSDGNGLGIRGMIERAAVLNGTLTAG